MQIRDDISITTYTVCVCLIKYLTSTSAFKHLTEYFVTTVSSSAKNTVRQSLTISKDFDAKVEECYIDQSAIDRLVPSTLEGCVVRISDMIAYIGKRPPRRYKNQAD